MANESLTNSHPTPTRSRGSWTTWRRAESSTPRSLRYLRRRRVPRLPRRRSTSRWRRSPRRRRQATTVRMDWRHRYETRTSGSVDVTPLVRQSGDECVAGLAERHRVVDCGAVTGQQYEESVNRRQLTGEEQPKFRQPLPALDAPWSRWLVGIAPGPPIGSPPCRPYSSSSWSRARPARSRGSRRSSRATPPGSTEVGR
jgi:hypothetical protein